MLHAVEHQVQEGVPGLAGLRGQGRSQALLQGCEDARPHRLQVDRIRPETELQDVTGTQEQSISKGQNQPRNGVTGRHRNTQRAFPVGRIRPETELQDVTGTHKQRVPAMGRISRREHHHTLSIAFRFRHLPSNSARTSYAIEGELFFSAQLSTDDVSALRKVWVL